ncbi:MAG: hypothetical protein WC747_01495 [Candidatus Babeliales bacterium]
MKKLLKNVVLFTVIVLFDCAHQSMSQNQIMQPSFHAADPIKKLTRKRRDLPTDVQSEWFHIPRVQGSANVPAHHRASAQYVDSVKNITPDTSSHVPYPISSYQDSQTPSYGHEQDYEPYYYPDFSYDTNYGPGQSGRNPAFPQNLPSQDSSPQGAPCQSIKNKATENKDLETTDVGQEVTMPTNSSFDGSNPAERYQAAPVTASPVVTNQEVAPALPQSDNSNFPWQLAVLGLPPLASYLAGEAVFEKIEQDIDVSIAPHELNVAVDDPISHDGAEQLFAFSMPAEAPFVQSQPIELSPIELSPNVSLPEPEMVETVLPVISQSNLDEVIEELSAVEETVDATKVDHVEVVDIIEQPAEDVAAQEVLPTEQEQPAQEQSAQEQLAQAAKATPSMSQRFKNWLGKVLFDTASNLKNAPLSIVAPCADETIDLSICTTASTEVDGIENAIQDFIAQRPALGSSSIDLQASSVVANSSIAATLTAALVQVAASAKNVRFIP